MQSITSSGVKKNFALEDVDRSLAEKIDSLTQPGLAGEDLNGKIEAFVQDIFSQGKEGHLKQFSKWSGDRTLTTQDAAKNFLKRKFAHLSPSYWRQLKCRMVAPSLRRAGKDKEIIRANTGCDSSSDFINENLPHLAGFDEQLLRGYFRKSFQKIVSIHTLVQSLEKLKEQLKDDETKLADVEELQIKLNLWAMHYLFRGAKPPILQQEGEWHLSFWEYSDNNHADYYRGDGGAIHDHFLKYLIEKAGYGFLSKKYREKDLGIITLSKFSQLFERLSGNPAVEKTYRYSLIKKEEHFKEVHDYSLVDVTPLLRNVQNPEQLQEKIQQVEKALTRLPEHVLVGGAVDMGSNIGVYLFFTDEMQTGNLFQVFKTFQGALGAYPDVIVMRRQLFEKGFNLRTLIESYPFREDALDAEVFKRTRLLSLLPSSLEAISEAFADVHKSFEGLLQLSARTSLSTIYGPMMANLITALREGDRIHENALLTLLQEYLGKIKKRVERIAALEKSVSNPLDKFQSISQQYHLIMEEILFLLIFIKLPVLSNPFGEILNALPLKVLSGGEIKKMSSSFSSGMAGYDAIFQACEATSRKAQGQRIKTVILKGSYFELVEERMLKDYLQRVFDIAILPLNKIETTAPCELLCLDLYPNYVPMRTVQKTPVASIIKKMLALRQDPASSPGSEPLPPLIVIVDTSTTLFWDESVVSIVQELNSEIGKNRVVLLFISSMAKMVTGGYDKFPGGVTQCYYQMHGLLATHLEDMSLQNVLFPEARDFFALLLKYSQKEIQAYISKMIENTDFLYIELTKLGLQSPDSLITLGVRETPIPILGFHFEAFLNKLLGKEATESDSANFTYLFHYYIYEKARKLHLPLIIRPSFGFPHAVLTECRTALRLILGIEDKEILIAYRTLFHDLNRELEVLLKSEGVQAVRKSLSSLIQYEGGDGEEIRNFLEENQTQVLKLLRDNDFHEYIVKLHRLKN